MTDELKSRLERLGERAPESTDAIERLRHARDRRNRRRARSALVVGLSVAIAGGLVIVNTIGDGGTEPTPGESPTGAAAWELPATPYLWPENWARPGDRELLASVQDAVDAGTPAVEWRLDPEQVVRRFLATVLAWDDPRVDEIDALAGGRVFVAAPPCPGNAACERQPSLSLVVDQPGEGGDGGVWSVVSVTSEDLQTRSPLGMSPALLAGSQVGFELALPEGRSAHAGLVASNGCREASGFALALESGTSTLTVPAVEVEDPSCGEVGAGYLFVYAMDDTTVPTGDPLLEAAAIEHPWLTMLPVEVQMGVEPADQAPA
jgi:hypothetical protein